MGELFWRAAERNGRSLRRHCRSGMARTDSRAKISGLGYNFSRLTSVMNVVSPAITCCVVKSCCMERSTYFRHARSWRGLLQCLGRQWLPDQFPQSHLSDTDRSLSLHQQAETSSGPEPRYNSEPPMIVKCSHGQAPLLCCTIVNFFDH